MAVLTLLLLLNFPLALQHPAQGAQEPYVPDIAEASDEAPAALARVRLPLDFELKLFKRVRVILQLILGLLDTWNDN